MANSIFVLGESGTGKSTAIRNLDPKTTFIINVLGKPLPFKGFAKSYSKVTKDSPKGNYYSNDDASRIIDTIRYVNDKRPEITTLIIDDFQYVMANEFMKKALEKGFEKFSKIGKNAWEILNALVGCREGLNCYVLSHTDVDANGKVKCKTIGRMLDDKITLEGMFTIVLHAITNEGKYKFLTQHDGVHTAKSPMGMFDSTYIDNDMLSINQAIHDYFGDELLNNIEQETQHAMANDSETEE